MSGMLDGQAQEQATGQGMEQEAGTAPVEVRRHTALAAGTGVVAAVVGAAYVVRAVGGGAGLDWLVALVVLGIAGVHLWAVVDGRAPLFVADELGVRLRRGRAWRGLPWTEIDAVEVLPRRRWLRDGSVDVLSGDEEPLRVPLSLSTRVSGLPHDGDLVDALADLAGDRAEVAEIDGYEYVADDEWAAERAEEQPVGQQVGPSGPDADPQPAYAASRAVPDAEAEAEAEVGAEVEAEAGDEPVPGSARRLPDPRPLLAHAIDAVARRLPERHTSAPSGTPSAPTGAVSSAPSMHASATPSALREPVTAVRAEIRTDLVLPVVGATALKPDSADDGTGRGDGADLPEARQLRRPGSIDLVEDTVVWGDRVRPIAREGHTVDPIVLEDEEVPAPDPVIGPELAAARTRLGLGVDQLADRTRIRPHVIEAIEVDDFAPCGGDFYARGHLRTLARVLGTDVAPLLAAYDERYADAPVSPRRVFEAELGQGGAIRGTRGGPNWSVLVAAVMALVLAWSVARLLTDSPVELRDPVPSLATTSGSTPGARVPVVLTASGGGAEVVVRDGANEMVYKGSLSFGEVKVLPKVSQPVRIQSSDGSLQVSIDGEELGALGSTGKAAQDVFVAE